MTSIEEDISSSTTARQSGASAQALERSEHRFGVAETACGLVVVVGVCFEYGPKFIVFLQTLNFESFRDLVGGLLIALGVAGEILFSSLAAKKRDRLRDQNALRVAELHERAEQEHHERIKIEEQLIETRLEIAKANKSAAEAILLGEQERLTRVKLAKSISKRRVITVTMKPNEGLRLFSETKVAIQFIDEEEPQRLANDITALLRVSEWSILGVEAVVPGQKPKQFTPPQHAELNPTGVHILTTFKLYGKAPWDVASYRAAKVLQAHLKEYDDLEVEIETPTSGPAWPPNLEDDAILIRIGAIPQSYFEELALQRVKKYGPKALLLISKNVWTSSKSGTEVLTATARSAVNKRYKKSLKNRSA